MSKYMTLKMFYTVDSVEEANETSLSIFDWISIGREGQSSVMETTKEFSERKGYKNCFKILDDVVLRIGDGMASPIIGDDVVTDIIPNGVTYILSVKVKFKKVKGAEYF